MANRIGFDAVSNYGPSTMWTVRGLRDGQEDGLKNIEIDYAKQSPNGVNIVLFYPNEDSVLCWKAAQHIMLPQ